MTISFVDTDELWPRDLEHRYRLVVVKGPQGYPEVLAAAPDPGGLGLAIITLHEDAKADGRRLIDEGRVGVLDVMPGGERSSKGEWIVLPWDRAPSWG